MSAFPEVDTKLDLKSIDDIENARPIKIEINDNMTVGALGNASYGLTATMAACGNLGAFDGDLTIMLAVALINGGLTQYICGKFC